MSRVGLAALWYRVLLRLLPEATREAYGAEMCRTYAARLAERTAVRRLPYVVRESVAVVRFGMTERLGRVPVAKRHARRGRVDVLASNVRAALGTLRRSPGFTAMAVLILGIGIGLTTAIFSALDAVLLRPSPYVDADELVNVERTSDQSAPVVPWPHAHYELVRQRGGPFSDVAAHGMQTLTLTGRGEPVRVSAEFVSDNYLNLLGIAPRFGRAFSSDAVGQREVLLSDRAWRQRFGGDEVLGVTLTLNGRTATVVGVLPPGFHGESGEAEVFAPIGLAPDLVGVASLMQPYVMWLSVIGRLRPGVTPEVAAEQMGVMNAGLEAEGEYTIQLGDAPIAVRPLHGSRIEPALRRALVLTFAASALMMIIVCLNISSLLLVRTQGRDRELAIRGALGASRGRLVGQLVTESVLLAIVGGLAGLLIAYAALAVLGALRPSPTPGFWASYARAVDMHEFRLDARVLAFTILLTLTAGVLSGMLPALRAYTTSFAARMRGDVGATSTGGRGWIRTRTGIVTAEIALAFVLVTAAGLVAASLARQYSEDLGFRATNVTTMRLQLPASTHTLEQAAQFYDALLHRLESLPGVQNASMSTGLPVTSGGGTTDFAPEGREDEDLPTFHVQIVSHGHFATLGIPLRMGSVFSDAAAGPLTVVISASTANMLWPGENPVGRRAFAYVASRQRDLIEVAGVVEDVQYFGVGEEVRPMVYLPSTHVRVRNAYVNVRGDMPPAALAAAMRAEVAQLDPALAITEIKTMRERVGAATSRTRFSAVLIGMFAIIAAFLAVLGVYGLVAYSVRSRSREFGVRLALGGRPLGIIGLMVGEVSRIAVIGIALGVAGSFAIGRVLQSQLYGVAATDVRALGAVGLLMLTAAVFAASVPALRVLQMSASSELMRD